MAKKKPKRISKPRPPKVPVFIPPVVLPVDHVLLPVPIEKTKHPKWHEWIDWLWK